MIGRQGTATPGTSTDGAPARSWARYGAVAATSGTTAMMAIHRRSTSALASVMAERMSRLFQRRSKLIRGY